MARRKSRYSGIGGQAVLEGVMMKNKEKYAVAVRKPDGEIEVRFRNHLLPGRYFLDVAVHAPDGTYYDDIRRIQAFAVTSEHRDIGVCRLESQWFVDGKALERKTGE